MFVCCMARGTPLLGDVRETSFEDVWRGEAYREARRAMKTAAKLPPCHRCDDFLDENRTMQRLVGDRDETEGAELAPAAGAPP